MATNSPFPLIVPRSTELRMAHFDEQIYKGDSSTLLYKIVDALSGTAGAGALVNEILLTRLGTALETIYFNELDYIFGKINFLARSPAESYTYNPLVDLLTSDQWDEVRIKDAWYRQRITEFFAACNLGSTPDGIRTCVHAALAVDADVYEIWRFCVDDTTEILTRTGYKCYDDLQEGDETLTLNMETGFAEWQPILSVTSFEVTDEQMLSVEAKGHSSLTTMDHRWPDLRTTGSFRGQHPDPKALLISRSADLHAIDRFIRAAPVIDLPDAQKYSDHLVELMGWFITEGHIHNRRGGGKYTSLNIAQSHRVNPEKVMRIRMALTRVFGPGVDEFSTRKGKRSDRLPQWRETISPCKPDMTLFRLNSVAGEVLCQLAPNKVATMEFIHSLTESQLRIFLGSCLSGDGHVRKDGYRSIVQNSVDRLVPIQIACTLLGIPTSLQAPTNTGENRKSTRVLSLCEKNRYIAPLAQNRKNAEHVTYTGKVWCPTTGNGTWFARRNNTTYFTGNCDNYHTVGYLGRAEQPARNEIVVRPHKTELAPSEARLVRDMLDKVTTVDTIVTVNTNGLAVSTPVPLASACADSVYFEVQKMVTPTPVLDNLPPPEMLAIDLLPTETWMWSEDKTLAPYAAFNIAQESSYYYLVGGGSRSPIDSVSYGCADVETEILTLRGWLSYDEVTDEDICLTLNTDTGQSEWQPVRGVYIFPGQHEVIKMENLSHSSVTTRDHRWPVTFADNRSTPGWSWRTTETLTPKTRICAAAPVLAPDEPKWSDALVELVAWMWTEGHVRPHGGVVITQSQVANPENVMRIRAALTQVFGPAGELRVRSRPSWRESIYEPERGIVNFHLNKRAGQPLLLHAPNKVVSTAFLAELTRAQLELFIQVSIDADGSWRPKNNECAVLRQRDRARVDAFQVACTLAGKAGTVRQQADGTWAMCVTKSPWRGPAERKYVQQTTIDTPVWCVSTANRTWFARRNGTVYATGNTLQSDGSVRAEANFEVYESGNYYTSWTGYETADSPDNYPGGKYGTHPRRAPAKNPDGTPYRFPYASQADYVAKKKAEVIAMGGVATDDYYRLPITTGPQTRHAYLPEYAVAYTAPAKESQISSSITRRRVLSVTPEVRSPDVFTRST